jgi:hypothetical protein
MGQVCILECDKESGVKTYIYYGADIESDEFSTAQDAVDAAIRDGHEIVDEEGEFCSGEEDDEDGTV